MKENFCNQMHDCSCECPEHVNCPLDDTNQKLEKDRSRSRNRHHAKVKTKKKAPQNAEILGAKVDRLPANATYEEVHRAIQRSNQACKKAERYK